MAAKKSSIQSKTQFLSVPEVAAELRMTIKTVRLMIREGQLKAVRPRPRHTLISREFLDRYLKRTEVRPGL